MKYVVSRYNQDISWLSSYTDDYVLYDRSEEPIEGSIKVANIGSDLLDKFGFIVDNYEALPDVAVYTKANLFKYITPEEFDAVKDNKTFTPLLTQYHKVYEPICRYNADGMYEEINNLWFLGAHPVKHDPYELMDLLGTRNQEYVQFAPGSNYILPKENILKHSKEFYAKILTYIDYDRYPGECQILERALYTLWR